MCLILVKRKNKFTKVIKYKSSKTAVKALALIFIIIFLTGLLLSIDPQSTLISITRGTMIFAVIFGFILSAVQHSYIEINETQRTIMYSNWPIKSRKVPIDKIIQIGYPKQNYIIHSINPFVYIWYDDPQSPGEDRYIKIKNTQFDPETLNQLDLPIPMVNGFRML